MDDYRYTQSSVWLKSQGTMLETKYLEYNNSCLVSSITTNKEYHVVCEESFCA